jgi:hypothetical protein
MLAAGEIGLNDGTDEMLHRRVGNCGLVVHGTEGRSRKRKKREKTSGWAETDEL